MNENNNALDFFSNERAKQKHLFAVDVPARASRVISEADKPMIDLGQLHLPTINRQCWQAIAQGNDPPVLFLFNGNWSRVSVNPKGYPIAEVASVEVVRHHLSSWAAWCKDDLTNSRIPPREIIQDVMVTVNPNLPHLNRIVSAPVFAPDGSLSTKPGYDPASGNYYAPRAGFEVMPIPETITQDDVTDAREFLTEELLFDFPFASLADRDNAIALFLLPFVRDFIEGATPNHLIDASSPGSGKTLLADVLMYATIGAPISHMSEVRNDEELSKVITSFLLSGQTVAMFDNINNMVNSGLLAKAWTDEVWKGRILNRSDTRDFPVKCVWIMTGNNVTMSSENVRRSIQIRLVPETDKPQFRTGFKHDIVPFCRESRARLVQCAHILVKWWLQQGRPLAKNDLPAMGSYESWIRVMGGILHSIGCDNFLGNVKTFHGQADDETDVRALFCSNWYAWATAPGFGAARQESRVADLLPLAKATEGFWLPENKSAKAEESAMGKWLTRHNETFVSYTEEDGTVVRYKIEHRKARLGKLWKISVFHSENLQQPSAE